MSGLSTSTATPTASLASVASFNFVDGRLRRIDYAEPAADLLPPKRRRFRPGA
jgi:hypothetical protein